MGCAGQSQTRRTTPTERNLAEIPICSDVEPKTSGTSRVSPRGIEDDEEHTESEKNHLFRLMFNHREGQWRLEQPILVYEELLEAFASAKIANLQSPEVDWSIGILRESDLSIENLITCQLLHPYLGVEHPFCASWFLGGRIPRTCVVGIFSWNSIIDGEIGQNWFPCLREYLNPNHGTTLAKLWQRKGDSFGNNRLPTAKIRADLIDSYGFPLVVKQTRLGRYSMVGPPVNW